VKGCSSIFAQPVSSALLYVPNSKSQGDRQ